MEWQKFIIPRIARQYSTRRWMIPNQARLIFKNQLHELNILKEITDRIGYSLSFEVIAEAIIFVVC